MSLYNHLTINEREKILFFYAKGYSISKIAKEINRNKSTISRELRRNKINNEYSPSNAQNLYINRRQKCKPKEKLSNPSIFEYVKTKFLEEQWSPEKKSRGNKGAIRKVNRKNSHFVTAALIETLKDLPLKTITPDRGKEFSKHSEVTKELGVEFYFPLPHHPWQRGTNENTNGLIREYFPKGFDITNVPHELVQLVEYKLNTRPRKCLGFKTPFEIFYDKLLHLA